MKLDPGSLVVYEFLDDDSQNANIANLLRRIVNKENKKYISFQ
ncbi:hypothetical protein [Brachyspira hyodysenteriae]|nr:hypothetical protein [Brachyspira hyodysenteriae]MCZ9937970.1 hypothetical protein [Brachyspira hyodysenteriae]MCZ9955067.1 hypothetical protein [Brachyspira hyodysenteriae]MCZ9960519.1 hypothetical protein [Brachyspira hyodysenteriae]MDA0053587.1 hypothetical protein [Brachyspira hyodysenteriae]